MKLSELTEVQRCHLAWRLDRKTTCGMLTAMRVARMDHGDLDVAKVFEVYGDRSPRSAKIHATKVGKFTLGDESAAGSPTL